MNRALDWKIENPEVPTDHQLISVKMYDLNTPHIGHGRWAIPKFLLDDNNFFEKLEEVGQEILTSTHHVETNPQKNLNNFIDSTRVIAKHLEKIKVGKMNSTIKKLKNSKTKLLQKVNTNNEEETTHANETANLITQKIQEIEKVRFKRNQTVARANWHLKGELINKYWCAKGKEKKGRDMIMELQKLNSQTYTTDSKEMANEMAAYHEEIQKADLALTGNPRTATISKTLKDLPHINDDESTSLNEELTYSEIEQALKCSPNNKAPGLNRIPTEVYKTLHKRHIKNSKNNKPSFDVIKLLKAAYNDIENNGITEKSLLEGWLCQIYKKKDC